VELPWGARLLIRPNEVIGSNLWYYGIFDLMVAETISRLLDWAEIALDIGANIGQMTSLMRRRTGPQGAVISFEPHPELFSELKENVKISNGDARYSQVMLHQLALSDHDGEALLDVGAQWLTNRGMSKIAAEKSASSSRKLKVEVKMLDQLIENKIQIGLCKIDVEGHELPVFKGGESLLRNRRIRDIVFEDFGIYPTDLQNFLLGHGYSLFSLHSTLFRPRLKGAAFNSPRDGSNYLATLDPKRALKRFEGFGWQVLQTPRLGKSACALT